MRCSRTCPTLASVALRRPPSSPRAEHGTTGSNQKRQSSSFVSHRPRCSSCGSHGRARGPSRHTRSTQCPWSRARPHTGHAPFRASYDTSSVSSRRHLRWRVVTVGRRCADAFTFADGFYEVTLRRLHPRVERSPELPAPCCRRSLLSRCVEQQLSAHPLLESTHSCLLVVMCHKIVSRIVTGNLRPTIVQHALLCRRYS